jgi:hypothetical protein
MSTFGELYKQMRVQKGKKAILRMLIETLDGDFLQALDGKPKKILLTDEKLPVEPEVIDLVIQDLIDLSAVVDQDVAAIHEANLKVPVPEIIPVDGKQITPQ